MKTTKFYRFRLLLLTAATLFAPCFFGVNMGNAQVKNWINPGVGQSWANANNWSPFGAPTPTELARIGNLPIAKGSNVELNGSQMIGALEITNQGSLYSNIGRLDVSSDILVSGNEDGSRSSLLQQSHGLALTTDNLTVTDGAEFRISNGAEAIVYQNMLVDYNSRLSGRGVVVFLGNSGTVFVNNGIIDTTAGNGGMVLNQGGDGLIDLDGAIGGGWITVTEGHSFFGQDRFTVNGTELADSFSRTINLSAASILEMNLSNGWMADASSVINIQSTEINSDGDATIEGGHVTLAGAVNLLSDAEDGGHPVYILADTTIQDTAVFHIESNNELLLEGLTTVHGGTFYTPSNLGSEGRVAFNALLTEWAGTVNVHGIAQQNGDANVIGPTTINAGVFDMDGLGGSKWNIDSSLIVNADSIDSSISNSFDGVINVGSILGSQLSVSLNDPAAHWTIAGELVLENNFPFERTLVGGDSRVRITGDLSVNGTGNRITADLDLAAASHTIGQGGASSLIVQGQTLVQAGAQFTNFTTLVNGTEGQLTLGNGASLDDAGLLNEGLLEIGSSPGLADVASFESTEEATWLVEIGGHILGDEFDALLVSDGETFLDGLIEVELIDTGAGIFLPEIGDQFTILTSVGEVSGSFLDNPVSYAAGNQFEWSVIYNPHAVVLELTSISVPEPSVIALALLGLIGIAVRRCGK